MDEMLNTQGTMQILTFFLRDQMFGIPIAKVQDVLSSIEMTRVPMSARHIEGVMNLRGRIVTAINLYGRMQADEDVPAVKMESEKPMNVVVDNEGELYSLLVDKVGDVLTFNVDDIEPAPMTLEESWRKISRGVCQLDKKIMIILDMDKIIFTERPAEAVAM